jgi:ATP-dependent Clp protease ATP-binding subunit ClpC
MFQRFTEKARRSIFFARYEASRYPSGWIEAEHLLLALVREDTKLRMRVDNSAEQEIRSTIAGIYAEVPAISTSADLPLSQTSKHILQQAEKEADELRHPDIDTHHLVLGLFKIGTARELLRKYGVDYDSYREALATPPAAAPNLRPAEPEAPPRPKARAASLESAILRLEQLIDWTANQCASQPDAFGDLRLKRKPWSRKEAVGHLIDCAMAHQGWIARALTDGGTCWIFGNRQTFS